MTEIGEWDICIIGGGATGLGAAVDAASRGLKTILFEKYDFAKGTSSRSTKLVHGGVRYLEQLNIKLVLEALNERGLMLKNAPHLVKNQSFVIPNYEWWEHPYYGIGMKAYDWMAGSLGLGPSEFLSVEETLVAVPTLDPKGLRGGIRYHDGQFDDARMAIHLAMTAVDHSAIVLNYFPVEGFVKSDGNISGVHVRDSINDVRYAIKAKTVINATGVFSDEIRKMDDPVSENEVSPSQGIHIVLDAEFLPSDTAILIPHTEDGRVLFAVPWHHKIIVGTTDTPMDKVTVEPKALKEEIEFVLHQIQAYLTKEPTQEDIRSIFCGLRPLVKGNSKSTSTLSRDHHITLSDAGLVSIIGGKWTTYRRMAQDTLNKAMRNGMLEKRPCVTQDLRLHGFMPDNKHDRLHIYGTHAPEIHDLIREKPGWARTLHPRLPYTEAEIRWICRYEMPYKLEDMLARRTRALFLDAAASFDMAAETANIMAEELGFDEQWKQNEIEEYGRLVKNYKCK